MYTRTKIIIAFFVYFTGQSIFMAGIFSGVRGTKGTIVTFAGLFMAAVATSYIFIETNRYNKRNGE